MLSQRVGMDLDMGMTYSAHKGNNRDLFIPALFHLRHDLMEGTAHGYSHHILVLNQVSQVSGGDAPDILFRLLTGNPGIRDQHILEMILLFNVLAKFPVPDKISVSHFDLDEFLFLCAVKKP